MEALKAQIGTLGWSKTEQFINKTLRTTLIAFAKAQELDISKKVIDSFLEDFQPVPEKTKQKSTDGQARYRGFYRKYKEDNPEATREDISAAWKEAKESLTEEQSAEYIQLGSKKAEKKRPKSTGKAWHGFHSEFRELNEAKDDDDDTKLTGSDIMSGASAAWRACNKGQDLSAEEIAKYNAIYEANQEKKEKEKAKKAKAAEKRKTKAAKKKAAEAKKAAKKAAAEEKDSDAESDSDSDSDSDDDKPIADADSE